MLQESFKNTARVSQINCCTLNLDDFRKLFEIVKEQNEESTKYQLDYIDDFNSKLKEVQPQEVVNDLKKL